MMRFRPRVKCTTQKLLISVTLVVILYVPSNELTSISTSSQYRDANSFSLGNGTHLITFLKRPGGSTNDGTNTTSRPQAYLNHRMDTNGSMVSGDRMATDSIIRPQLALQIFAGPVHSSSDTQQTSSSRLSTSGIPAAGTTDRKIDHPSSQGRYSSRRTPQESNWRYETELQPLPSSFRDGFSAEPHGYQHSASTDPRTQQQSQPIINAIITVPTASDRNDQARHTDSNERHSSDRHQASTTGESDDLVQTSTQIAGLDQVLSRIIDNQQSGNLEFSMNMNGDEIVINPINKHNIFFSLNNSRDALTAGDDDRLVGDHSSPSREYAKRSRGELNTPSFISKALKKHVSSDMAGVEQSASEIDVIDGKDADEGDADSDLDKNSAEGGESRPKLKDIESEIDREEQNNPHRAWVNSADSTASPSSDEDLKEEKVLKSRSLPRGRIDERSSVRSQGAKKVIHRTNDRKIDINLADRNNRKVSGSKQRATFRASSDREELPSGRQNVKSAVMIDGEDVRRFERLLEEMRALSLKNLSETRKERGPSKSSMKSSSSSGTGKSSRADDDRDAYGAINMDDIDDGKAKGHLRSSSKRLTHSSADNPDSKGDCDRKKDRIAVKGEDSDLKPETDSTVNISDQEASTSGDGVDELNDEGTQNIEQQEERDASGSVSSKRVETSEPKSIKLSDQLPVEGEDQPKTIYVRKTILQNYYDDDNNVANDVSGENQNVGDDLESVHRSRHESQHEMNSMLDGQGPSQQAPSDRNVLDEINSHRQVAEVPAPLNNYIDYSQLNDREVYRGSESQKFKVSMKPRDNVDRMRILQQVVGKVAMDQGMRNHRDR